MLQIPYRYLNAEQVRQLQEAAVTHQLWNVLDWGNYGPNGVSPLVVKKLADCDTSHLEAILITQPQVPPHYRATILELLKIRWQKEAQHVDL